MKQVLPRLSLLLIPILFTTMIVTITIAVSGTAFAGLGDRDDLDLWADVSEEIDVAPGYEDPKDRKREWTLSIGVAGGVSPEYEGSDDYELSFGPNFSGSWRNILFFKGKTLGASLVRQKNFKAGPILSLTSGRDEDDNDTLDGLGDVDSSVEAGGFLSYRNKPWRFRMEARQDIGSGHEGALVEMTGGTSLPFKKPLFFAAIGTTWASDDYMESFFGINAKQSADSGHKKYKAESGIKDVSVSLTAGYPITNHWRLGGMIKYKRLLGDAADSPIVDDKNQFIAGLALSYRMGSKALSAEFQGLQGLQEFQ